MKNFFFDVLFGENLYIYCVEGNIIGFDCRMLFDINSIIVFDNGYFWSLVVGCGILILDNILFIDFCIKLLVI